jgi:hypothetical protein
MLGDVREIKARSCAVFLQYRETEHSKAQSSNAYIGVEKA